VRRAADSSRADSPQADSSLVALAEAGSVEDGLAAPQGDGLSPADYSVAPEPQQRDARLLPVDCRADSSVDSAALPVGLAAPHLAGSPDVSQSLSLVCPEAPASPSAAPPHRWPDAASALRFSPTVVRDARPEPAAVSQTAPVLEAAFS
jgi:hypothetical protein